MLKEQRKRMEGEREREGIGEGDPPVFTVCRMISMELVKLKNEMNKA